MPPGSIPSARVITPDEEAYGHNILTQLSQTYQLDYNDPRIDKINAVVDRLAQTAGYHNEPWHVFLFNAPTVKNAAATRGNHIFVWSGLLDVTKTDDELAAVLSHEMAHLLAGHTDPDPNEQMKKILIGVGTTAASIAISVATRQTGYSSTFGRITADLTDSIGEEALINPYSREKEFEADHIGLMLMTKAGYNPEAAIEFWTRLENDPDLSSTLQYFNSHPTTEDRLEALKKVLPLTERFKTAANPSTVSLPLETNVPETSTAEKPPASSTPHQVWVVVKNGAKLHRSPNKNSRAIGEFRRGARVETRDSFGDWLEVVSPDYGFIEKHRLKKEH